MAIYFNNKVLEPKENGNSLERRYFTELQEVRKLFESFRKKGETKSTLIFSRDFPKVWNSKKTTYKPAPPIALPLVSNIYLQDIGSVQIRYSKDAPTQNEKGKTLWRRGSELFYDIRAIGEDEMDYAWFILKATNYIEKGLIKLVNRKVEFDKDFNKIKLQARPYGLLFSDERTEQELLNVVADLFPANTISYENGISELAIRIWDAVTLAEKNGDPWGYTALLQSLQKEIDKKNATVGKSIKIVKQETGDDDEEEIPVKLLKAPVGRKKADLFAEATEMGLPVTMEMKNNMIYSMIMAAKEQA